MDEGNLFQPCLRAIHCIALDNLIHAFIDSPSIVRERLFEDFVQVLKARGPPIHSDRHHGPPSRTHCVVLYRIVLYV